MKKKSNQSESISKPAVKNRSTWVQTERSAHEAWAHLIVKRPRAAILLHHLVARMGYQNAVVVSQKTLSKMIRCSERTVRSAIRDLVMDKWIQVIQLNGPGTVSAYVVNSSVAWGQPRDQLHLATFSAAVVADIEDQDNSALEHCKLRSIPVLYPGEGQLPTGTGEAPPSQPCIEGLEPDLPTLSKETPEDMAARPTLELHRSGKLT